VDKDFNAKVRNVLQWLEIRSGGHPRLRKYVRCLHKHIHYMVAKYAGDDVDVELCAGKW